LTVVQVFPNELQALLPRGALHETGKIDQLDGVHVRRLEGNLDEVVGENRLPIVRCGCGCLDDEAHLGFDLASHALQAVHAALDRPGDGEAVGVLQHMPVPGLAAQANGLRWPLLQLENKRHPRAELLVPREERGLRDALEHGRLADALVADDHDAGQAQRHLCCLEVLERDREPLAERRREGWHEAGERRVLGNVRRRNGASQPRGAADSGTMCACSPPRPARADDRRARAFLEQFIFAFLFHVRAPHLRAPSSQQRAPKAPC
jgi:hypothetical protein